MQLHEIEHLLKFSELTFFVMPHKNGGFIINITAPGKDDFETLRTQRGPIRVFKTLDSVYSVLMKLGVDSFEVSK